MSWLNSRQVVDRTQLVVVPNTSKSCLDRPRVGATPNCRAVQKTENRSRSTCVSHDRPTGTSLRDRKKTTLLDTPPSGQGDKASLAQTPTVFSKPTAPVIIFYSRPCRDEDDAETYGDDPPLNLPFLITVTPTVSMITGTGSLLSKARCRCRTTMKADWKQHKG